MSNTFIDGNLYREMFLAGSANLANNVEFVNSLNVFPVPDGDTGTNMNLTTSSGAKDIQSLATNEIGEVAKKLSRGLLMGARGNSGVILSQIFRGIAKGLEDHKTCDIPTFAAALGYGRDVAYKAVMKPVEGTILTVIKDTANAAEQLALQHTDFIVFMEAVLAASKVSLLNTPELLPILKEVGVVDSGGQGLVIIFEGMVAKLKGESTFTTYEPVQFQNVNTWDFEDNHTADDFGFCTEFIIRLENPNAFNEVTFHAALEEYGNSIVVVADEDIMKVHIHTEKPFEVFALSSKLGEFVTLKSENMQEQFENNTAVERQPEIKKVEGTAIISVAAGSGIAKMFRDMGSHYVIEGGQTMNPSTQDFVDAIEKMQPDAVIILPNNGNIIMAAEQVKALVDIPVEVVLTKSIPQGMSALMKYHADRDVSQNAKMMSLGITDVKTGQITYAVRDTSIDGLEISANDYMGIFEKAIVASNSELQMAFVTLAEAMIDEDSELLTLFTGEEATKEQTAGIVAYLEETFEDVEVEVVHGGQPVYHYLLAVE
ncbi:MAG: DAK2 domain-containing protein [Culicoidibacterales bacterium]